MQNVIKHVRIVFITLKKFIAIKNRTWIQKCAILALLFCITILGSLVIQYVLLYQISHLYGLNFWQYAIEYLDFSIKIIIMPPPSDTLNRNDAAILFMGFKLFWFSSITIPYLYTGKGRHLLLFFCGTLLFSFIFTIASIGV